MLVFVLAGGAIVVFLDKATIVEELMASGPRSMIEKPPRSLRTSGFFILLIQKCVLETGVLSANWRIQLLPNGSN